MEPHLEQYSGKKILITGGGGYLGSKLTEILVRSKAEISLLDISFNSLSEDLICRNNNVKKHKIDITKKKDVKSICEEVEPDYIFHFCALLNRARDFNIYSRLYDVNVKGTLNLLHSLQSINYTGLYFSGTSEVYGSKNEAPFHETLVPFPESPYSLTKLMAEEIIKTYSEIYHKPYSIFRIFNFYGLDMPEAFFINQLIAKLRRGECFEMTKGEQERDFIYIDDLISAILSISNALNANGKVINICTGKGRKIKEIAIEIAAKLKREDLLKIGAIPYRRNEIWHMVGSNHELHKYYEDKLIDVSLGINKILNK